jgi:type II secretory pathway pseudopilin PulG
MLKIPKAIKALRILRGNPRKRTVSQGDRGFILVEALMAVAVVSIGLVAAITALGSSTRATTHEVVRLQADSIAKSQMEDVRSQPFAIAPTTYASLISLPAGYTTTAEAEAIDGAPTNIQMIIVTVTYEGREMRVLEGVKVNR